MRRFIVALGQAISIGTYGTFLVLLVPVCVAYGYILKYVRHTSIEVQRLEANARSPVSCFSCCPCGGWNWCWCRLVAAPAQAGAGEGGWWWWCCCWLLPVKVLVPVKVLGIGACPHQQRTAVTLGAFALGVDGPVSWTSAGLVPPTNPATNQPTCNCVRLRRFIVRVVFFFPRRCGCGGPQRTCGRDIKTYRSTRRSLRSSPAWSPCAPMPSRSASATSRSTA
jgi:hypothetical protein